MYENCPEDLKFFPQFIEKLHIITSSIFFILFGIHIQPFFNLKQFCIHPNWAILIAVFGLRFQIHQKLNRYISDLLYKPIIFGTCGFPLTNLHSDESVDFVP